MLLFGSSINVALLGLTILLSILNFFSIKKEFLIRKNLALFSVAPLVLMMMVYWYLFRHSPLSPLFMFLFMTGLIIGGLFGMLTKVYYRNSLLYARRSRLYLGIWLIMLLVTQGTVKVLGTAIAGVGITFMFFSLGMVLAQQFILGAKAGTLKRGSVAALTIIMLSIFVMTPGNISAKNVLDGTQTISEAYTLMALDAYSIGNYGGAREYARKIIDHTSSPGTQAVGYMILFKSGGGEHYASVAHEHVVNSGQMQGRTEGAALIGLGILDTIDNHKYVGYYLPAESNIIAGSGFGVASSQLPGLWEGLKRDLGFNGIGWLEPVTRVLDTLIGELAATRPVSEATAAVSAAAAALILAGSTAANVIGGKVPTPSTAKPGKEKTATPPPVPVAESGGTWLPDSYTIDLIDQTWGLEGVKIGKIEYKGTEDKYKELVGGFDKAIRDFSGVQRAQNIVVALTQQKNQAYSSMKHLISKGTYLDQYGNLVWRNPVDAQKYQDLARTFGKKSSSLRGAQADFTRALGLSRLGAKMGNVFTSVGSGLTTGLRYGAILVDTLGNMTEYNRADGSLIHGDSLPLAAGKAATANTAIAGLVKKNPLVAVMELGNLIALGDVDASEVVSPIGTLKNTMNYGIDLFLDMDTALDRLRAGAYGSNVRNFYDSYTVAMDFVEDPARFTEEFSTIMQDEGFFEDMQGTIYDLFRRQDGTQGYIAAGAEQALNMGVAMTQTAADMAGKAGTLAGTLYENTSQLLSSSYHRLTNWYKG